MGIKVIMGLGCWLEVIGGYVGWFKHVSVVGRNDGSGRICTQGACDTWKSKSNSWPPTVTLGAL